MRGHFTSKASGAALLLLLAGCGGKSTTSEAPAPDAPETSPDATPEVDPEDIPTKVDIEAARTTARTAMFVPAPSEFQAALATSAEGVDLKKLIADTQRKLDGKSRPVIALETGVRITNVMLSAHAGADKGRMDQLMGHALEGLTALQAPPTLLEQLGKVRSDFASGVIGGSELVPALDVLAQGIHEELSANVDRDTAVLVQAGGWLQAADLLSKAVGDAGLGGDAAALLHQPSLLAFFLEFLKNTDPARAGDPTVTGVITQMEAMAAIAGKAELSAEDVKAVHQHTTTILGSF